VPDVGDVQAQILAIMIILYLVVEFIPVPIFLKEKKPSTQNEILRYKSNIIRKRKRVADYCEKFSVGCFLIGLFQSSKWAIILAVSSILCIFVIERFIDQEAPL
jgi:hypothetical protein